MVLAWWKFKDPIEAHVWSQTLTEISGNILSKSEKGWEHFETSEK